MEKKEKEAALRRTGERRVHTNGVEIAYETFGDRGDPPVLLIMGLSTQMIMWEDEFCQRLAGRGFFVIRFDNRDVGMSTKLDMSAVPDFNAIFPGRPAGVPYTLHDMTYDTLGLMDSLDISRAHIVGASMGGMIAQLLALKNPLRVHTLTLIMLSLIHISEPTRLLSISYAVFCLKKKNTLRQVTSVELYQPTTMTHTCISYTILATHLHIDTT